MIQSDAFSYINVLDKALDTSWTRETLITNNLANVDTPGYKRQDIDFESILEQELGRSKYEYLDQKIDNLHMSHLNPQTYTDSAYYSYRIDDNNVDADTENVELASEQIRYQALESAVNGEFTLLKTAMSGNS